jgi:hypothetical protein
LYLKWIFRTFGADKSRSLLLSITCTSLSNQTFGFSRGASKLFTGIGQFGAFCLKLHRKCGRSLKSRIPVQAQFARTLRRDLEAMKLSMTTPRSNGPIEGHINRLKAIKRQVYGRAGFELLRARVLPWNASSAA